MEIKHNPERFTFDLTVTQPEHYLDQMRLAPREVIARAITKVAALEEKNAEQAMILLLNEKLKAAELDAQRYRWLRDSDNFPCDDIPDDSIWDHLCELDHGDFDEFIDRMMLNPDMDASDLIALDGGVS